MKKLKEWIGGPLTGHYVSRIKKRRELEGHCALSLLLDTVLFEQDKNLPFEKEFWDEFVDPLIQSYETNKNWDDVLKLCY